MSFTENLGILLKFQKICILPNYQLPREDKTFTLILRLFPLFIAISFGLHGIYEVTGQNGIMISVGSGMNDLLLIMDKFVNVYGLITILIFGYVRNKWHLNLIETLVRIEKDLTKHFNIQRSKGRCWRIYFDLIINLFQNFLINFFSDISSPIPWTVFALKICLLDSILMLVDDFIILYVIHFIKQTTSLIRLLKINFERDILHSFSLMDEFLKIVPELSISFGGMLYVLFAVHFCICVGAGYFLFLFIFDDNQFQEFIVLLVSLIYFLRSLVYVGYLSFVGNNFSRELDGLFEICHRITISSNARSELKRTLDFNKAQFHLRRFFSPSYIVIGRAYKMNISGLFSIMSITATYFLVLVQFKQLEEVAHHITSNYTGDLQ
uniref:Uncharacterized protein n=1 Tax=Lutzomyia longipalpis TaxID=7200 RepID=A0A3F2ZD92_LUTLO